MAGLSAGVGTDESSLKVFAEVKAKRKDFAIFAVNAGKTLVVPTSSFPDAKDDVAAFEADEKERKREANFATRVWPKFKAALVAMGKAPCYAVLDLRYVLEERAQDKLVFFFWCPEAVAVRDKMVGASTYQSFSAKLGVAAKIQCQDASDLDLAAVITKVSRP